MTELLIVAEEIPFGKGKMILLNKISKSDSDNYYAKKEDNHNDYFLEYEIGKHKKAVNILKDITVIAKENNLFVSEEIKGYEEKFSRIISALEDLGRLVTGHPLYSFLESEYGFDYKNHIPTIKNNILTFITIPFSLENLEPPVNKITLDLKDMMYVKEILLVLTKNKL